METPENNKPSAATAYPPEKTFELMVPVELGGQTYSKITLSEPTAAQVEQIEARGDDPGTFGISLVGAVPLGAVQKLKSRDFNALRAYLHFFINAFPTTG